MDKSAAPAPAPTLEITVISVEGLRLPTRFKKSSIFVTVRTDDSLNARSTTVNRDGFWNEKLHLALPRTSRSVAVELHCKTGSGSKPVGSAIIPVSDIVADFVPAYHLHFLSYRLREGDGERNGIVNLSVRMVGPQYIGLGGEKKKTTSSLGGKGFAIGIPVGF